ncbi:MAG: Holliday junction resolvase RuvX [Ignavibacteriae bacterium]|nr:Holliday junction resolvase RuvX [Ignavibacteriota bacterium]
MQRCLGIDYGSKRIGIAISDPLNIIARPLKYLIASTDVKKEFENLLQEFQVKTIVIGMPYNLKGEKGQKAEEVEKFITDVLRQFSIEIVRWDERFTSKQAHQTLRDMNVKKKQRQSKEIIDAMAAAILLQSYLDSK